MRRVSAFISIAVDNIHEPCVHRAPIHRTPSESRRIARYASREIHRERWKREDEINERARECVEAEGLETESEGGSVGKSALKRRHRTGMFAEQKPTRPKICFGNGGTWPGELAVPGENSTHERRS